MVWDVMSHFNHNHHQFINVKDTDTGETDSLRT